MMPKTLSASSLEVAKGCMARFKVENIDYAPTPDNDPAMTGTAFHYAAEHMVRAVYLDKVHGWDRDRIIAYYKLGFIDTFGHSDFESDAFKDGLELTEKWYERTDLSDVEVLDVENKKRFPLRVNADITIPMTYIFDRVERVSPGVYRVTDYKTIRAFVSANDLKGKIQPRLYAVAAQLEYPDAERIWVQFDLIRHGEPVGIVFTREENQATYQYLKREAARIINTPEPTEKNPMETLNKDCGYCIRKTECDTLLKHTAAGGVLGMTPVQLARKKAEVAHAIKALDILDGQLDELLEAEGQVRSEFEFDVGEGIMVEITAKKSRRANQEATRDIIGPELVAKYGNITVGVIDKLLKSNDLTAEQKAELKKVGINRSFGSSTAVVKLPNDLENL
jgi:hypothetical protein